MTALAKIIETGKVIEVTVGDLIVWTDNGDQYAHSEVEPLNYGTRAFTLVELRSNGDIAHFRTAADAFDFTRRLYGKELKANKVAVWNNATMEWAA